MQREQKYIFLTAQNFWMSIVSQIKTKNVGDKISAARRGADVR